jgi:CRISPR system Cascade subunit CasC
MNNAKFIQIHTLTSYPGTLLNRDDAGFAKRLPFGGATRTRISSQCLKYHWRHNEGEHSLYQPNIPHTVRSRQTFRQLVAQPLIEEGYPPKLVVCVVNTLKELVLSGKPVSDSDHKKILQADKDLDAVLDSAQVTILGRPEVDYLRQLTADIIDPLREELGILWNDQEAELTKEQIDLAIHTFKEISEKDLKKNLKGMKVATGLDAAMFGRMATSDILARGDAAIHVAHAFTTHAEESESDYFSAIDELVVSMGEGELGSGHINTNELTSGLFYGYVVVDVPLLISNLEGCKREEWTSADRTLAADVVERLIHLIATASPGAKLGSTAPYSRSECVLVEVGTSQPRTLANAFRRAVDKEPDLLENTYRALAKYASELDNMYGTEEERRLSAIGPVEQLIDALKVGKTIPLPETASWAAEYLRG